MTLVTGFWGIQELPPPSASGGSDSGPEALAKPPDFDYLLEYLTTVTSLLVVDTVFLQAGCRVYAL